MPNFQTLCQQFAHVLNGKHEVKNGVCTVEIERKIPVTIQGRPAHSEMEIEVMFESLDQAGNALNRGEIVILEEEVPYFIHSLVQNGIMISALHNHWLYTKPTILYIHFQSIEPPLTFAHKVSAAIRTLKKYQ